MLPPSQLSICILNCFLCPATYFCLRSDPLCNELPHSSLASLFGNFHFYVNSNLLPNLCVTCCRAKINNQWFAFFCANGHLQLVLNDILLAEMGYFYPRETSIFGKKKKRTGCKSATRKNTLFQLPCEFPYLWQK